MPSLIFVVIVLIMVYGIPSLRRKSRKKKLLNRSLARRNPSNYGNVVLDNVTISQRGRGVLNPSAMYSDTLKDSVHTK
ncbi:MAG: hypothetical protein J6P45_08970 [Lachnospiraceae bacterium]|nr:hypothetical protein [Lachnospiraceae bacterium]MBR1877173.1 hypothetical protein [Lachnospiraceae bacterium]